MATKTMSSRGPAVCVRLTCIAHPPQQHQKTLIKQQEMYICIAVQPCGQQRFPTVQQAAAYCIRLVLALFATDDAA